MLRSRLVTLALGTTLLAATVACNRVRVEDVKGPDGGDWVRISCRHMDRRCYQVASRMCPSGYYFAGSAGVAPVVRAREVSEDSDEDGEPTPVTPAPTPQAGVNTTTLPPQESWSHDMYSRKSGAILVRCAGERTASND